MWEKYFKKGREAYVIELIVEVSRTVSRGSCEVSLEPIIWDNDTGSGPRTFKTKAEANRFATQLLNGQTTYNIVAYSVRRMCLTIPKKEPRGEVESTGG
jgi:hypothetical protein